MKETLLEFMKRQSIARGYRFEVDKDGTERMIRPDGTVALIVRQPEPKASPKP